MKKRCRRCGNEDEKYFYQDGSVWYCRKCVGFGRLDVGSFVKHQQYQRKKHHCSYTLAYPLTSAQLKAQQDIVQYTLQGYDVLAYAACGAGKTEMVMEVIKVYLNQGRKVGFAISRRQVVLEIRDRMQEAFSSLKVIAVCEGYTDVTDADLIICTMHQLYRYDHTFDLLIMDEVDAFPYRGNEMLETIAHNACIGQNVYLTATPEEEMLIKVKEGKLKMVELFQRPHGYPLIVPDVKMSIKVLQYVNLLVFLNKNKKEEHQVLLFVPTIAQAQSLTRKLKLLFTVTAITSKTKDKETVIADFHKKKYFMIVATTILERGITIKGINVVILHADHPVFNEASLIQMIGRVGRSIQQPSGSGLFLCSRKTQDIKRCIHALHSMNEAKV